MSTLAIVELIAAAAAFILLGAASYLYANRGEKKTSLLHNPAFTIYEN